MTANELLKEILQLSPEDRIHLLEKIVNSLDAEATPEEMEKRMKQIASGEGAVVPGDEELLRARSLLEK